MNLDTKHDALRNILNDLGKVVVAFSGGVDSSLLLKAAAQTLGPDNVLACISAGVSEPSHQLARAAALARDIGVELMTVETDELEDPNFVANQADRCFHCKSHLCRTLLDVAAERGFSHVVFGTNYDDLDDFRPGNRAIEAFEIRSPLAEAKLTKSDIRQLSRQLGLPTADMPSSPCLASRISYGLEVTAERLRQIDEAEAFLRDSGFVEFRVRHHDDGIHRRTRHQRDRRGDRAGQRDAARLDHHMVDPRSARDDVAQGPDQVATDAAADATTRQGEDVALARLDQRGVDRDLAEVVHQHGDAPAAGVP